MIKDSQKYRDATETKAEKYLIYTALFLRMTSLCE